MFAGFCFGIVFVVVEFLIWLFGVYCGSKS